MKVKKPAKQFAVPTFIVKLYAILEDPENEPIIQWNQTGDAFVVINPTLMESQVLQQHFKHNHFSSFLRQLNMYDFQKIRNQNNQQVFWHTNFQKDKQHLLVLMRRNQHKLLQKQKSTLDGFQQFLIDEITQIKNNQRNDEVQFTHIVNQHELILQQHKQLYMDMNSQRQVMDKKFEKLTSLVNMVVSTQNKQDQDQISMFFEAQSQLQDQSEFDYSQNNYY